MDSFTPTEFLSVVNQTLEYAYDSVLITGEVASFKVNQGKWVFFDLKDEESSVSCFMTLWDLRTPLEDGMKIIVRGTPKVTKWGKFSFTVSAVRPTGEGSLKKAYELLKKKLTEEGLFNPEKKRPIPKGLTKIGVISSTGAAGYADFIKIMNTRWGGIKISVAHTQVQGLDAPDQIIRALKYFNERGEVEAIAILRGGGSADDLSCFNDEKLVREIASSKIPIITGIGHEVDESLADLAADVRASTPSNVAEMLTRNRTEERAKIIKTMNRAEQVILQKIEYERERNYELVKTMSKKMLDGVQTLLENNREKIDGCLEKMRMRFLEIENQVKQRLKLLEVLNPEKVLSQGYAIIAGKISPGKIIEITTFESEISAEVKEVKERK